MNKLTKIAPAWHDEAVKLLKDNFAKVHLAFTESTKRAVWLGLFLQHIKLRGKQDKSIPHGAFGPWMEKHVPDVPWRTANTYMQLAKDVCEKGKFEIRQFSEFAGSGELPPAVLKLIEGKTASPSSTKSPQGPVAQHASIPARIQSRLTPALASDAHAEAGASTLHACTSPMQASISKSRGAVRYTRLNLNILRRPS